MKRMKFTKLSALLLAFVMVFTTVVPMNVSATSSHDSSAYHSQVYSVNGITAYAYDGADLSQEGVTFEIMKDNKSLAKALYYSYGSLGYSKEYKVIDTVYSTYGAKVTTDKLAISEMVLTKIMNEDASKYDAMTESFLAAIEGLTDYDSAFTPYYILSADKAVIGYTSTSAESYEMPKEETEGEATGETSTEEATGESSGEASTEGTEDESAGKAAEEDVGGNLQNPDGTYKDGIRNRNKGVLSSKLGDITSETVLTEIDRHWSDDTYFGRADYDNYDFVSTLLSNISGTKIKTNIMEFANENNLEVYQFSGSVSDVVSSVRGLQYAYCEIGDVIVVTYDDKEYCGIYTELAFYQRNLDAPNKNCFYNEIPGYETLEGEFDAKGNEFAWVWYNGETTKLSPLAFDGDIKLSVIKINRDMQITAEGQGYKDLGNGAILYQEVDPDEIPSDAVGYDEENEEGSIVANSWEDAFTHNKEQLESASNQARYGAWITANSDGRHATMRYRVTSNDEKDHENCGGTHTKIKIPSNGKQYTYCDVLCAHKGSKLITCGEAKLTSVTATNQWSGGNIKIENYNKPSISGNCDIQYASSKYSGTRLNKTIMVNPGQFVDESFNMRYCRDAGSSVPGRSSDGYYELYLEESYVKSGKVHYKFAMIWYQDARLRKEVDTQRLCTTFSLEEPVVDPVKPSSADGSVTVRKISATSGGTLANGEYTFQIVAKDKKTVLDTKSVTVSNGASTTATLNIKNCFTYSSATKASNGAPQYKASCDGEYYLKEISAPSGMTCDSGKLMTLKVQNFSAYQAYIQKINEVNVANYNNEYSSYNSSVPSPEIYSQGTAYAVTTSGGKYADSEIKPGVGFTKTSASSCASFVTGNPNYSLAGAEYGVYTDAACTKLALWYPEIQISTSALGEQDVWNYGTPAEAVFHTNADGTFKEHTVVSGSSSVANTFAKRVCMNPGTYWIQELKAPKGYKLSTERKKFTITADSQTQSVTVTDEAVIDPFSISFTKQLTGGNTELGGVKVSDATFKLEYFTDSALANKKYEASFKTGSNGVVNFSKDTAFNSTFPDDCWKGWRNQQQLHLPTGYIRVTEINNDTNANVGTLRKAVIALNDGTKVDISKGVVFKVEYSDDTNTREKFTCITANNTVVDENTVEKVEDERVKRFDICFTKKSQDGEPMEGVPFIIENTVTGEKHLVVSDENGFVTTRRTDLVKVGEDGSKTLDDYKAADAPYYNKIDSYIKDNLEDMTDSVIVNNELAPAPVWFYGTTDDVSKEESFVTERDEEEYHGSLIYADGDEYVIYEVPTKQSNGKQIVKKGDIKFGCTTDGKMVALTDGKFDATIINYDEQKIKTLSRDAATQSRYTKQSATATVIDNFEVTNLKYNHSYTVKGVLVARNTTVVGNETYQAGELIKDSDGKYITAHSAFVTGKTAGDGSTVDDKYADSRRDNSYTSYETDSDGNITAHTSLVYNFNTLDFSVCNAVWYTYLCDGIEGAGGVDLVIADGKVDKEASNVIKERAISEENGYYDYVEDEDLTNDKEFVDVVCIDTNAFTEVFGTTNTTAGKETEIFDTVVVNGLVDGAEYQLVSKLVNPETGDILVDENGDEIIGKLDGATDKFVYVTNEDGAWKGVVKYPKIDATGFAGKSIVCLQYLYDAGGVLVGESTKLTNDKETIHFPKVGTQASGDEGAKTVRQYGEVEILDEVRYESLALNREYVIVGTLHYLDKDNNEQTLHYKDGSEITASVAFTPTKPNETSGIVTVPFKFNVSDVLEDVWEWEQTVVFEDIYDGGKLIVSHADITDKDQSVLFPSIHTSLREGSTGVQHIDTYNKDITLVDTVSYSNLKKGKTYRIIGKLVNQETGEVLKDGDKEVTATAVFTPAKNGDVFSCEPSSSETSGDSDDSSTGGSNDSPGDKDAADTDVFKDYVSGAVEVKFEFNGKNAGLIADDKHNVPIVAYEYVYDNFDMAAVEIEATDEGLVDLYKDVNLWTKHNGQTDVEQTITAPTGHTTLTDSVTSTHVSAVTDVVTLTDKISYRGLLPGKTYVATGTLYIPKAQATDAELILAEKDENGNECCPLLDENGRKIQGSTTFVAETPDGEVAVSFTFNKSLITQYKKQVVAFEEVSVESEGVVFTHKSITDKDQTVFFPEIHTTALSEDTSDHLAGAYANAKIIDTVQVSNLESNRKYKLVGTLMNQTDGNPLLLDGKEITSEKEFESATENNCFDGTVDVVFEFDSSLLAGKTAVAYEVLYIKKLDKDGNETDEWVECGNHKDITDEGQTVHFSDLHTTALGKDSSKHKVDCAKKVTIVDTVTYSNLIPGKQYRISGLLMAIPEDMKATDLDTVEVEDGKTLGDYTLKYYPEKKLYIDVNGYKCKPLIVNGKTITGEVTFVPTESDGTIDVEFTFDSSALQGRTIVVFEDLYNENNVLVGNHADITDKGQTIKVGQPDVPGDDIPSIDTGDNFPLTLVIVLAVVFSLSSVVLLVVRRKFLR